MRLLLDTNVLIWLRLRPQRLGAHLAQLEDITNDVLVSAVTGWEIAIKSGLGKLQLPESAETWVPRAVREIGAEPVSVSMAHAVAVAGLPPLHRDPFDRLLVAQALTLGATLVTANRRIAAYPADTILV